MFHCYIWLSSYVSDTVQVVWLSLNKHLMLLCVFLWKLVVSFMHTDLSALAASLHISQPVISADVSVSSEPVYTDISVNYRNREVPSRASSLSHSQNRTPQETSIHNMQLPPQITPSTHKMSVHSFSLTQVVMLSCFCLSDRLYMVLFCLSVSQLLSCYSHNVFLFQTAFEIR